MLALQKNCRNFLHIHCHVEVEKVVRSQANELSSGRVSYMSSHSLREEDFPNFHRVGLQNRSRCEPVNMHK